MRELDGGNDAAMEQSPNLRAKGQRIPPLEHLDVDRVLHRKVIRPSI
jgi:hypothetical protein